MDVEALAAAIDKASEAAKRVLEEELVDSDMTAYVIAIPVSRAVLTDPDFRWKDEAKQHVLDAIDRQPSPAVR